MRNQRAITRRAPAKVNLTLAILGLRPDGFHEIESWIIPIDWFDTLHVAASNRLSLVVEGRTQGVPTDESNLACRAAALLAEEIGRAPDVSIRLEKSIPPGGGLGGGSSDAAAVLLALNELWNLHWPTGRLGPVAARLGSDVPFFLRAQAAVVRGRGEWVEPISDSWSGVLAIVVPPYGIPTAEAYRMWDQLSRPASPPRAVWEERHASAVELSAALFNDLERAAFACEPRLGTLHAALQEQGGRPVRMTGSGSCLFAIFDSLAEANDWRTRVAEHLDGGTSIHVVNTMRRGDRGG